MALIGTAFNCVRWEFILLLITDFYYFIATYRYVFDHFKNAGKK